MTRFFAMSKVSTARTLIKTCDSQTTPLSFWIGLFFFALYLLSFSGELHRVDELARFTAANNLAQHGRTDINQLLWTNRQTSNRPGVWGADENLYLREGAVISFVALPFAWLGHRIPGLNAVHLGLLSNILVTALTAGLLVTWLADLGFSPGVAVMTSLGYGGCTVAWGYTRTFGGLSILALLFLMACWTGYRAGQGATGKARWFWGILSVLAVLLGLTLLGNLAQTKYAFDASSLFWRQFWTEAIGALFSPKRGLFTNSPFLFLLFFGLRPAWRQLPRPYFWLLLLLALVYWLFSSAWFAGNGLWGPRFLLPILPLFMVFVAAALASLTGRQGKRSSRLLWLGAGLLAVLSLLFNLLGLVIELNEYFRQLDANSDFVFNWYHFPPLVSVRLWQAGWGTDLIWLERTSAGFSLKIHLLLPALIILLLTVMNLWGFARSRTGKAHHQTSPAIALVLTLVLLFEMMLGTAHSALESDQAQADLPWLTTLAQAAQRGDRLLIPISSAAALSADIREFLTRLLAYQDVRLPVYIWLEDEAQAVRPTEQARIWEAAFKGARRIWLFEPWLSRTDPLGKTAGHLNQASFPLEENWFERSGKLTLYTLSDTASPAVSLNVPFEGQLSLVDFSILSAPNTPGGTLKLRLTWRLAAKASLDDFPSPATVAFAHLLDDANSGQVVAQNDRTLVDLRNVHQSALLPGQTISQGYALPLPADLPPGSYSLIVGLYDATTLQRLFRIDNSPDDFLYLTTLKISN